MDETRDMHVSPAGSFRLCRYHPSPQLSPFIRNYWTIQPSQRSHTSLRQRIVPDGCIDVLFVRHGPTENFARFVVGTMTAPIFEKLIARSEYLGIRFAPGGFRHFFRIPTDELADRIIPMESLPVSLLSAERLTDSPDISTRFEILESSLNQRLLSDRQDPTLAKVVETISAYRGDVTVTYLAHLAGRSARHLRRIFHESIGVGPKTFCEIIRFKNALHRLRHEPAPDLLQVALAAGYYDQAHFIHDFNRFYGASPSVVLKECRS